MSRARNDLDAVNARRKTALFARRRDLGKWFAKEMAQRYSPEIVAHRLALIASEIKVLEERIK